MPAKGPDEYYSDDLSVNELADIKALHEAVSYTHLDVYKRQAKA